MQTTTIRGEVTNLAQEYATPWVDGKTLRVAVGVKVTVKLFVPYSYIKADGTLVENEQELSYVFYMDQSSTPPVVGQTVALTITPAPSPLQEEIDALGEDFDAQEEGATE